MKNLSESEKIEKKREEVLSRGKKFKYPLQFSRHRVVIDTIAISVITIALLIFLTWLSLFRLQNTSDLMYRLTQAFPLSVATIDGAPVRFSDYLMLYKSSEKSLHDQISDADAVAVSTEYKRAALTLAEDYAYAEKLAKDYNITVTDEEIDNLFLFHQTVGGIDRSKDAFLKVLETNFKMNESEYRHLLKLMLTRAKVAETIDDHARALADEVARKLAENGNNLKDINIEGVEYFETGTLINATNIDGGRATKAASQDIGTVSGRFVSSSGDAYYFVKTINKTSTEVSYASLKIPFTEFTNRLNSVREDQKVHEKISL